MAFDFPSSPTLGQTFTPAGGPSYTWTGSAWTPAGPVIISDTAPTNPAQGQLWWQSSTGKLWISFFDGSSTQWVSASIPGPQGPGVARLGFSVHRNGVDQTGITVGPYIKVFFTSSHFLDVGAGWDMSTSRWTPPAGKIFLNASLAFGSTLGTSAGANVLLLIYKNGSLFKSQYGLIISSSFALVQLSMIDYANGSDYYEVWCYNNSGTGTSVITGSYGSTYLMGSTL